MKKSTFDTKSLSAKMDSMEHASLNLTGIKGIRDVDFLFLFFYFYFCQGGIYENHTERGAVSCEPKLEV